MNLITIAAEISDVSYYNGWDKVGAVAVAVLMLGVLVMLHRSGLKRVDQISDRHMGFVEQQTKVLTSLTESNRESTEATKSLHHRIDSILTCRKNGCPFEDIFGTDRPRKQGKPDTATSSQ